MYTGGQKGHRKMKCAVAVRAGPFAFQNQCPDSRGVSSPTLPTLFRGDWVLPVATGLYVAEKSDVTEVLNKMLMPSSSRRGQSHTDQCSQQVCPSLMLPMACICHNRWAVDPAP